LIVKAQKIIIFPVVCGSGSSTCSSREEHGLREFQNRVLRNIFGSKTEKVVVDWRKLYNEEVHDLYLN
jgi:hypothetical protein